MSVLQDIVDSVTTDTESKASFDAEEDEEDEEEPAQRFKRQAKESFMRCMSVFCIWDCTRLWIKTSEILSMLVFDPFTELFITICIIVNVIFMALDQYNIEYDWNDGM